MSVYVCGECGRLRDAAESPPVSWNEDTELICETCQSEHSCTWCGEMGEGMERGMHKQCLKDYQDEKRMEQ